VCAYLTLSIAYTFYFQKADSFSFWTLMVSTAEVLVYIHFLYMMLPITP